MVSAFGILAAGIGALALVLPAWWSLAILIGLSPFRTAMAFAPPGMGGASVLVPHFFLVFVALRVLRRWGPGPMLAALAPPSAGFALFLIVLYGLAASVFFPRALAGVTEVISLQRDADGESVLVLVPLAFGGTHLTQSIYAVGGLIAFAASFALFRAGGMWERVLQAMLALCALNVALALVDLLTHASGTAHLLGFMRNSGHAMLVDSEKGGLKRLVGSFSETSAFAVFTLALFAFVASLWLDRTVARVPSGVLAALLLALLVASTSGTAYVGLALLLAFLGVRHALSSGSRRAVRRLGALLGLGLIALAGLLGVWVLAPGIAEVVTGFLDETVFGKIDSQSGQERAMWNAVAWRNAVETWGLGVGIGGARASSYVMVLLSNVGAFGFLLYLVFAAKVLGARPAPGLDERERTVLRAARATLVGFLIGHVLVGTIFDQSPLFYALAGGIAAACVPRRAGRAATASAPLAPARIHMMEPAR